MEFNPDQSIQLPEVQNDDVIMNDSIIINNNMNDNIITTNERQRAKKSLPENLKTLTTYCVWKVKLIWVIAEHINIFFMM